MSTNTVEVDGKFYKEAQHLAIGDRKLFNSGSGPEVWIVSELPAKLTATSQAVGVTFCKVGDGQSYHKVWSVGQVIEVAA